MKAGKPLACDKGKLFKKRSVDRLVSLLGAFRRRRNRVFYQRTLKFKRRF